MENIIQARRAPVSLLARKLRQHCNMASTNPLWTHGLSHLLRLTRKHSESTTLSISRPQRTCESFIYLSPKGLYHPVMSITQPRAPTAMVSRSTCYGGDLLYHHEILALWLRVKCKKRVRRLKIHTVRLMQHLEYGTDKIPRVYCVPLDVIYVPLLKEYPNALS